MPGRLTIVDASVQETNAWLKAVSRELGGGEKHDAYAAVRAVLQALRDRLPPQAALIFAGELPLTLRGTFVENWRIGAPPLTALTAPRNIAASGGQPMTITDSGFSAMSSSRSAGTTYDGATRLIRVAGPVTAGDAILFMSVLERGDRLYDTSAFIDNLRASSPSACSTRVLG